MSSKLETFIKSQLKTPGQAQAKQNLPDIRTGDTVRVEQKIPASAIATAGKKEEGREKTQVFEGLVIARKHGQEIGATITLRKVISGIGVERIFPLYSPTIEKIEILKREKVRRAKLYYLREAKGKKAKLKKTEENR